MELIREIESRKNKSGKLIKWAEFLCEFPKCGKIVERQIGNGIRQQSCGCQQHSEEVNKKIADSKEGKKTKPCSEERKQKISLANKGKKRTEEQRQRISKRQMGVNNPNYGNGDKMCGDKNPMYGVHNFGKNTPNWNGGTSFLPYPPEFNKKLKQVILRRDNYTCQDIYCKHLSKRLHVHHIDYDKKNNNPENLITLCNSCHSKTNGKNNRQYFTELYQNMIMNKLIECLL